MDQSGTPMTSEDLAEVLAPGLGRLMSLLRSLSQPEQMSFTSIATLATLERQGPSRITALAVAEGVTQPAMTQLIDRLQEAGLVGRGINPADGRVVQVSITEEGRALLARRRATRAERLARLLSQLPREYRDALADALPAIEALASARYEPLPANRFTESEEPSRNASGTP
jgi:DNA-binding MarR family transcriptional regulator